MKSKSFPLDKKLEKLQKSLEKNKNSGIPTLWLKWRHRDAIMSWNDITNSRP